MKQNKMKIHTQNPKEVEKTIRKAKSKFLNIDGPNSSIKRPNCVL
jgi:hypothetical protein